MVIGFQNSGNRGEDTEVLRKGNVKTRKETQCNEVDQWRNNPTSVRESKSVPLSLSSFSDQ